MCKKRMSCGYRCVKKCLNFNNYSKKGISSIPYDKGIYLSDIKEYLDKRMDTTVYEIEQEECISSNMIIHTFYRNKGHYLYVVYSGSKYMFIYDPRCIIPYKLIRKKMVKKYIDFKNKVIALKINKDIDYRWFKQLYLLELLFVVLVAIFGLVKGSLFLNTILLIFLSANSNEK